MLTLRTKLGSINQDGVFGKMILKVPDMDAESTVDALICSVFSEVLLFPFRIRSIPRSSNK
jgi:hypothetical protein